MFRLLLRLRRRGLLNPILLVWRQTAEVRRCLCNGCACRTTHKTETTLSLICARGSCCHFCSTPSSPICDFLHLCV
jgi:hypothetical protein